jgi:hypothetical protein
LTLAYLKHVLALAESGLSLAELELASSKPCSTSSKTLLDEVEHGLEEANSDLAEDKLGLEYANSGLRQHSFTGIHCLSVHCKISCSHEVRPK